MKNILVNFMFLLYAFAAMAQAPQKFNYQAVVRDAGGTPLDNTDISVRLNINDLSPSGYTLYSEQHDVTTNQFGLFTVQVGGGTVLAGVFTSIDWATGDKFLETAFDANGATGGYTFTVMGATQLISVPYSLSSHETRWVKVNGDNMKVGDTGYGLNGSDNVAIGKNALYSFLPSLNPYANTAVGSNALNYNTGYNLNNAFGSYALRFNSGDYNNAFGSNALDGNSGSYNTAVGNGVLYGGGSGGNYGSFNTGVGAGVLYFNGFGYSNTAIGANASRDNSSGNNNTAIGIYALRRNTMGNDNAAIGANTATYGNHNQSTFLGASINISTDRTNVSVLGYGVIDAQCTDNNQILIGNTAITQIRAQVTGITAYSDARFKTDISDNVQGLSFITKLKPVTYHENPEILHRIWGTPDSVLNKINHSEIKDKRFIGLLAQDVEKAAKESGFDFPGIEVPRNEREVYSLRYTDFIMPLVKAVQEQQQMIEELKKEITELKNQINGGK